MSLCLLVSYHHAGCLPGNCVLAKRKCKLLVSDMSNWVQFNGQWYVGIQNRWFPGTPGCKLDDSCGWWCLAWASSLSVTITQRWQWVPETVTLSAGLSVQLTLLPELWCMRAQKRTEEIPDLLLSIVEGKLGELRPLRCNSWLCNAERDFLASF